MRFENLTLELLNVYLLRLTGDDVAKDDICITGGIISHSLVQI